MKQEDFNKLSSDEQLSYWIGRLLMAIGMGNFRSEVYFMVDFYRREAYQRGLEQGEKNGKS